MSNIQNLLKFTEFTHKFQQVKRTIYVTGEDRNENDSEHSFQIALISWYLADSLNLNLDKEKLIMYSLAHDLVETYAGDTFIYSTDKNLKDSKVSREKEAAERIKSEFPEFKDMHTLIHNYEERNDEESKFIYALDKMLPVLNIYLDGGKSWQRDQVTYEMIRTKDSKIAISEDVTKLWTELIKLLDKNKSLFFPAND